MKASFTFGLLLLAPLLLAQSPSAAPRPKLQFINGSTQAMDIFWLKSPTERVPNGSVAPGDNTIITTTLGHRFAVVGRDGKGERIITSEVPVQAMRFDPPDPDGIPAFYTQRLRAGGFPIVASAKVNPYALKEATYLLDLMLAKRPDVRAAMVKSGARLCIIGWNEFTTDQPEFARVSAEMDARRTKAVEMAAETYEALVTDRDDGGRIWASVLKEAIKRRNPGFNENYYGYRTFGNLLEDASKRGLIAFGRDEKSGTYVFKAPADAAAVAAAAAALEPTRSEEHTSELQSH